MRISTMILMILLLLLLWRFLALNLNAEIKSSTNFTEENIEECYTKDKFIEWGSMSKFERLYSAINIIMVCEDRGGLK